MIKEFAIEPEFLNSPDRLRYIEEKFGVYNGRIILRYPSKWLKLVWGVLNDLPPREKKKAEEKLIRIKNEKLIEFGRDYEPTLSWLLNAVNQYNSVKYDGIISNSNPDNISYIIVNEELDESNCCFGVQRSKTIEREATKMAAAIMPLLKYSKDIMFVDPYFEKLNQRHIRPLKEILLKLASLQSETRLEIKYFTSNTVSGKHLNFELKRQIGTWLPGNIELIVYQCPSESMHNRYIITDRGGIIFGIGLDDNDFDNEKKYDDISLMDEIHWREKKEEYDKYTIIETHIINSKSL